MNTNVIEEYRSRNAELISVPDIPTDHTQDWADKTINFCTGCPNDCKYCYAKGMAVRFNQVKEDDWPNIRLREHDINKRHKNYGKTVMVPSSHDIVPENLDASLHVLRNLLAAENDVLIVTKPHLDCVKSICQELGEYKDQILFRFTIGARNNAILKLWEPGAPIYEERLAALQYAFKSGFETSVSCEPMLDSHDIVGMVAELLPFVTDTIWIGKLNYLGRLNVKSEEMADAVERINDGQADERIIEIYREVGHIPQIKWKKSFRKVICKMEVK